MPKFERIKYKQWDRTPVGCYEATLTSNGWKNSKYTNSDKRYIMSDEVGEAMRFIYEMILNQYKTWPELNAFAIKYGTLTYGDFNEQVRMLAFVGERLDYAVQIAGNNLSVFLYRKVKRGG